MIMDTWTVFELLEIVSGLSIVLADFVCAFPQGVQEFALEV